MDFEEFEYLNSLPTQGPFSPAHLADGEPNPDQHEPNEVIANHAIELAGGAKGQQKIDSSE